MPRAKLTKRTVDALAARSKVYIAYDDVLPGFGCRVTSKGSKSWIVEYRPNGGGRRVAKRRTTLGSTSTLTADQARRAAQDTLARVRLGEDVAEERARMRASATIAELAERYMRHEVRVTKKASTVALYDMYFRRHVLPELGTMRAIDAKHADILSLHRKIGEDAPVTANRVMALISGLYSWAVKAGEIHLDRNPTQGLTRYREEGRERYLTEDELRRLGDALRVAEAVGLPWQVDEGRPTAKHAPRAEKRRTKLSPFAVAAIRLLLFSGCRLREILHLRWEQVDLDRGLLFLPDSKTGRKTVVLSSAAMAVLESLERIGTFVVPGNNPDRARADLKKPWEAIAKYAGLDRVRLHDLRHTYASIGAAEGLGLPVIGKLLGHRQPATTARYAHLDAGPLRRASDVISDQIAAAMNCTTIHRPEPSSPTAGSEAAAAFKFRPSAAPADFS
jgi:integrase